MLFVSHNIMIAPAVGGGAGAAERVSASRRGERGGIVPGVQRNRGGARPLGVRGARGVWEVQMKVHRAG